nr:hypothetical protein KitaXyl93_76180 [Kitasatospora sp. Xyl93]
MKERNYPLDEPIFVRYFGQHVDKEIFSHIEEVYEGASDILESVLIEDHQPNMMVGNEAGVHAYTVQHGPISLADRFWSSNSRQQALTLVHEATHAASDTHDESGFGRSAAEAFAAASPAGALMCAYNYEYFADEAGSASLSPESESESESESERVSESESGSD